MLPSGARPGVSKCDGRARATRAEALLLIAIYLLVWEIALRLIARSED